MLVRGVVGAAYSASIGAVLQIILFLLQSSNIRRVQATLPPGAEDEIIVIEHWPGRRVHLQDFFWTGLEDAPPWVDPQQGLNFDDTKNMFERPNDENPTVKEPLPPHGPGPGTDCINCVEPKTVPEEEDETIGVLIGDDPGPRYWLLTVLRAGESVPSKIELRLARLYRTAFSRQQQRHLGLLSIEPHKRKILTRRASINRKKSRTPSDEDFRKNSVTSTTEEISQENFQARAVRSDKLGFVERSRLTKALRPLYNLDDYEDSSKINNEKTLTTTNSLTVEESTLEIFDYDANRTDSTLSAIEDNGTLSNLSSTLPGKNVENQQNGKSVQSSSKLRSLDRSVQGIVQVKMHNTSVLADGSTRLIYSVHLGGKPVPAETAARDMALLSEQEVALELGAPVIVQSEPYLKESRPLALSRKRDAWLLIGAAGAALILLAIIVVGLVVVTKRKRAHSAVSAPPTKSILKNTHYLATAPGHDNAGFSSSETEAKSDGSSRRQTLGSLSRTPAVTPETPDSLDASVHDLSSDNDEEIDKKTRRSNLWESQERVSKTSRIVNGKMARANAVDRPRTPDSMETTVVDQLDAMESLENGFHEQEDITASPHSYLSMPPCKQFPSVRTVEPLSRVLEPVTVKHLDIDSPEMERREDERFAGRRRDKTDDKFLVRTMSAAKDPGVIGPIVWNLRTQGLSSDGLATTETDAEPITVISAGPVGRARRRLHELLEDSFSLFGSRDSKDKEPQSPGIHPDSSSRSNRTFPVHSEQWDKSVHISPAATPTTALKSRPSTSVPRRGVEEEIVETGLLRVLRPRGAWGSRPMSAGPFHKPTLPEVDTRRILVDTQLSPQDPAVPLIASIKKELEKFT